MIELKPCPFCGSKSVEVRGNQWYWVECRDCYTSTTPCSTEKEAIEAWNKRTEPPTNLNLDVNGFSDYAEFE